MKVWMITSSNSEPRYAVVEGIEAAVRFCKLFDPTAHHVPNLLKSDTNIHIYGKYPFHVVFSETFVVPNVPEA